MNEPNSSHEFNGTVETPQSLSMLSCTLDLITEIRLRLRQQLRHDVAMHVGQAEIAALEAVGQLGVVEAE